MPLIGALANWIMGKIALAIGVPVLFYAILKSQGRKPDK